MRTTLVAALVGSITWLTACATTESTHIASATPLEQQQTFSYSSEVKTLDNGLKIVLVPTQHPNVVSMNVTVSVGSRNEVEVGKTGFAHFFEHMMFKGTSNFPQEVYDEKLKNAGVDNRAYTTNDHTNYYSTFSKQHLPMMIELEGDRFQNLTYTEAQFRTEALTVKGEYLKNAANPIRKILQRTRKIGFTQHTYQHTTMGFFEDIEAMPDQMAYAQLFFDRYYRPENVTITLTGDFDPEQAYALVQQYWSTWKAGSYQTSIPTEPEQKEALYSHIQFDGLPGHWISIAFKGPKFDPTQKDKPALDLLAELYFSNTSDFYREIVTEQQKASEFFTYLPNLKDPGLVYFIAKVNNVDHIREVRDAVLTTLMQARSETVKPQQLNDLKSHQKYIFINQLDSAQAIGSTLAQYVHFKRDPHLINQTFALTDTITPHDIQQVAQRYFVDEKQVVVTMSALESLTTIEQKVRLVDFKPTTIDLFDQPNITIVDHRNDSPLIDISWLFNTGPGADPENKKGLAALTALMIAEGSSNTLSYQQIQEALYPIAGSFTAQIDKEMTVFRGRIHQDNLQDWYHIVREQLLSPQFNEQDLKRLKIKLINQINSELKSANDEELGKEVLYQKLYTNHPYESLNIGHVNNINELTIADVKAFYQQHFFQKNLTLGATGAISDDIFHDIVFDLAALPERGHKLDIPVAPSLSGRHATIIEKPTSSTAVSFGFPIAINRSHPDWVALWLVRSYLGEHRSHNSFLYQRIRQIRGMNYGDYAYIEYFPRGMFQTKPNANLGRSSQIFQVWLRPLTDHNNAHFATRVALYELDQLISQGLSATAFEQTKNFLSNYVTQLVASQGKQLGYALDSQFYQIPEFVHYVQQQLQQLTLNDVNRVIRDYLQTENLHFVFITEDAKKLQLRLATEQASPMSYNAEKPDSLLSEDKVIAKYPLSIPSQQIQITPIDQLFID